MKDEEFIMKAYVSETEELSRRDRLHGIQNRVKMYINERNASDRGSLNKQGGCVWIGGKRFSLPRSSLHETFQERAHC